MIAARPRLRWAALGVLMLGGGLAGGDNPAGPAAASLPAAVLPARAGVAAPPPQAGWPWPDADWPMYGHDPSRTSYNPVASGLGPATAGELTPRWQVNVGIGIAPPSGAPSVANGHVYVGSSVTTGPNFFALDETTGTVTWTAVLGHSPTCFNVGIGATAAISGDLVVAGGEDGAYYGLDAATGTIRWRQALDAGPSGYAWASPLIAGGRAYVGVSAGCDNPSVRGAVRALALNDGHVLADQAFVPAGQRGAGIWNSPALSPDGRTLVVATGEDYGGYNGPYNRAMVALDSLTLHILGADQRGPLKADKDYGTTPIVFSDAQHRTLVAAHHKDENFYVYDLQHLAAGPIWQQHTGTIVGMMPGYDPTVGPGGTLFFIDGLGRLTAVDPATGQARWPPLPVGIPRGNMAITGGLIFVNAQDCGVVVVDDHSGQIVNILRPAHPGKAYSGVVVAGEFVYWLSGAWLNAWSLPDAGL